jgi:hypothetical protein
MNRTLRSLLLIFAILWQSLAMLSPLSIEKIAASIDHGVLHTQEATHHHHHDASAHIEDTAEGLYHQHADSGMSTLGLLPTITSSLSLAAPLAFVAALGTTRSSPTLEGLLRPPRLQS